MGGPSPLGALALALALTAAPAVPALPDAMSLGAPRAKVVLDEYASLTCPHCARFQAEVFPAFKKKYVDTGKVRYVLHEFLTPPAPVAAAGWLLARCGGPDRYFAVVDDIFKSQSRWTESNIKPVFLEVAKAHGLTEAQFNACLGDEKALAALQARVIKAEQGSKVNATPTFMVNGKLAKEGEMSLEELDAAIAAAGK
jgi:protein-disulfide isomerase